MGKVTVKYGLMSFDPSQTPEVYGLRANMKIKEAAAKTTNKYQ